MGLSDILPNGFKSFVEGLALRYRWIIPVSHDVFCASHNYHLKS